MCGRISNDQPTTIILERFKASPVNPTKWENEKNLTDISPGREIPIIMNHKKDTNLKYQLWGWFFFVKGAKGGKVKRLIINSRDDTAIREYDNPSKIYQRALTQDRVIIPVNAFYEWKDKRKHKFSLPGENLFSIAGISVPSQLPDKSWISTVTLFTTSPNEQMSEFHNRMPLVLKKEDEARWLYTESPEDPLELFKEVVAKNDHEFEVKAI